MNKLNKTIKMSGRDIKSDNGSGRSLSQGFPGRRFHDNTIYVVSWNGVQLDGSTITSINRSSNGWAE